MIVFFSTATNHDLFPCLSSGKLISLANDARDDENAHQVMILSLFSLFNQGSRTRPQVHASQQATFVTDSSGITSYLCRCWEQGTSDFFLRDGYLHWLLRLRPRIGRYSPSYCCATWTSCQTYCTPDPKPQPVSPRLPLPEGDSSPNYSQTMFATTLPPVNGDTSCPVCGNAVSSSILGRPPEVSAHSFTQVTYKSEA